MDLKTKHLEFDFYLDSFAPLGKLEQVKYQQEIEQHLQEFITDQAQLVASRNFLIAYFKFLRSSPNPQIIVSASDFYDLLLAKVAYQFNEQNLLIHLVTKDNDPINIPTTNLTNISLNDIKQLEKLPYISALILTNPYQLNQEVYQLLSAKLNRDGHYFQLNPNLKVVQPFKAGRGLLLNLTLTEQLANDFKQRLLALQKQPPSHAKLKAVLDLETDYYQFIDYLDRPSLALISTINQIKNETLSQLTQ